MATAAATTQVEQSSGVKTFSDELIDCVASGTSLSIGDWIRKTARDYGVIPKHQSIEVFARAASRLSDSETELDPVEELLIALRRSCLITSAQRTLLHVNYLR